MTSGIDDKWYIICIYKVYITLQTVCYTDLETDRQRDRDTERGRDTCRHIYRQTYRQRDRNTEKDRERERKRETDSKHISVPSLAFSEITSSGAPSHLDF